MSYIFPITTHNRNRTCVESNSRRRVRHLGPIVRLHLGLDFFHCTPIIMVLVKETGTDPLGITNDMYTYHEGNANPCIVKCH